MQLPQLTVHHSNITRFARYVSRRLRRAGKASLAKDTLAAGQAVREAGRAWEDSDDLVQDALADRDGCDDDLDGIAQAARATLAGRSPTAVKEEPYTLIFPEGLAYYTAAPLDEEVTRYEELAERLTRHLPAADSVRKTAPAAIKKGLTAYKAAAADLDKAERAKSFARTDLDRAKRNCVRQLEKVYGAIMAEEGRPVAEGFFPKAVRGKSAGAKKVEPEPSPEE